MTIHKLNIDDFDDIDYDLIAIHTSLEDYRLAFLINQNVPILLSRSNEPTTFYTEDGEVNLLRYVFEDEFSDTTWTLIQNKKSLETLTSNPETSLFDEQASLISKMVYLLPEFKKVDYFLKIENGVENINNTINLINKIDKVSTVYSIDVEHIKSKNNLIF